MKMHLQESRTSKFSGGTWPRTPLGLNALRAFGKYTRLLLLSTHLRKNLLKPLHHDYFGSVTSRLDGTGISVADRPG